MSSSARAHPWAVLAQPLAPERRRLVALGAALLGSTLLPLAGPQLLSRFVDDAAALARAQRRVVPQASELREQTAQLMGNLEERLAGAEDIKANGAGQHVLSRFHEASARVYRADLLWQRSGGLVLAGTNLLFGV